VSGVLPALLGAVLIAALMTLGDFVWARFVPAHRVVYGHSISGIWTRPAPGGPDYPWHFLSWSFAFLPGFLALSLRRTAAS
jgi:hypothetical protein